MIWDPIIFVRIREISGIILPRMKRIYTNKRATSYIISYSVPMTKTDEILCNLDRLDQRSEQEFRCGAYEKIE